MKKITSLILCIVLTVAALTALSVAVFAVEGETPAVSDITHAGYQNKNGGFDIRIVGKIANEANYREVGFVFSNGTTSKECAAKYMFKTLLASDGENTYEALTAGKGEYLFAYIIEGIEKSAALTLSVKPYAVNQDNEKIYGEEKTLVKKADEQFAQETVHTHTPIHHEATVATAASYATAWNTEYWSCEGCSKLFSDAACTTVVEADAVMAPAQKGNADFVNSETNPYLLANVEDYNAFAAAVSAGDTMAGKFAKITVDLGTTEAPITAPIGTVGKYFGGTLDGDNHTVIVELNENAAVGLVSYLAGGTVKNVTVRGNVTRQTASDKSYAGGIVGLITAAGGTVTDCTNYATVTGPDYCSVGGIVGHNTGVATIENCANYGEIKGGNLYSSNIGIGGIIGRIAKGGTQVTNCHNYGKVSGTNATDSPTSNGIGGVAGFVGGASTLTNVSNEGAISGPRAVGGIIGGTSATITVNDADNSGAVTATDSYIGGIVGYVNGTGNALTDCTNTGNITGAKCIGGIIGLLNASRTATVDNAVVRDCTLSGTESIGGWIGRIVAKATATYKNYAAPTGVTYQRNGEVQTAIAGFDNTDRTVGANTAPGEAFGTCPGTATNVTE